MVQLYWESQVKDLCRKHSLNAYLGRKEISERDFEKLCDTYDKFIKHFYGEIVISRNYDIFPAYSLISYVVHLYDKKYSFFIPYDLLKRETDPLEKLVHKSTSIFVFNHNHVYLLKFHNNKWHKIDSLSGIVVVNLSQYRRGSRMGFIIPRLDEHLDFDIKYYTDKTNLFLQKHNIKTDLDLRHWLATNFQHKLLDDLEIHLANLMLIYKQLHDAKSTRIEKFLRVFYQDKLDFDHVYRNLPLILSQYSNLEITPTEPNEEPTEKPIKSIIKPTEELNEESIEKPTEESIDKSSKKSKKKKKKNKKKSKKNRKARGKLKKQLKKARLRSQN